MSMRHRYSLRLLLLTSGLLFAAHPVFSQEISDSTAPWQPAPSKLNSKLITPLQLQQATPAVTGDRAPLEITRPPPTTKDISLQPLEEMYSSRVIDQLSQFG